jgi:hypothetical protein
MLDPRTSAGRRKRLLILAVATVVVYACGVGVSRYATRQFLGIDAESLDADLRSSLPLGSSMEAGRAWFARHGIEPWEDETVTGRSLTARLPNDTVLETGEIRIWLDYGFEGRLKSIGVGRTSQPR